MIADGKRDCCWLRGGCVVRENKGGGGVTTMIPIPKGEIVAIFGGYIMRVEDEPGLSTDHHDFALQVHDEYVIGPKYPNEIGPAEFINHSCEPNCGIKGQIFLVSMRGIVSGDEITFDYAMVFSETQGVPYAGFECRCNSPRCRGHVTDSDWRIPELQKRYDGYFSWYLQEKINNLKKIEKGNMSPPPPHSHGTADKITLTALLAPSLYTFKWWLVGVPVALVSFLKFRVHPDLVVWLVLWRVNLLYASAVITDCDHVDLTLMDTLRRRTNATPRVLLCGGKRIPRFRMGEALRAGA